MTKRPAAFFFIALSAPVLAAPELPAGWWQAARPVGTYGLVGCTVAPGFEFDDFGLLRDDAAAEAALRALDPTLADLV